MHFIFLILPVFAFVSIHIYVLDVDVESRISFLNKKIFYSLNSLFFSMLAGYIYFKWGITEHFIRHFIVISLFYVSFLVDIKSMELPIEYYLAYILPAFILFFLGASNGKYWELLYFIATAVILCSISHFSKNAFGFGDAIFITVMSYFLGFYLGLSLFLVALCVAGVGSLVLVVLQKVGKKTQMPFIPFLLLAYIFHLLII